MVAYKDFRPRIEEPKKESRNFILGVLLFAIACFGVFISTAYFFGYFFALGWKQVMES